MAVSYLCKCRSCGRNTSKSYARQHGGECKTCVTGEAQPRRSGGRSYDDIARDGGYEDTMGVSPDCYESYRCGGDYGD